MRTLIAAAALVVMGGCATEPISADKADPVPVERLYGFGSASDAQLVVTRDSGLSGSGCKLRFQIDGKPAADFYAGEVGRFGVRSGEHILAVEPVGICGGSGIFEAEVELNAGDVLRRRISGAGVYPTNF